MDMLINSICNYIINSVNYIFTGIYILEMLIKMVAYNPLGYL